MILNKEKYSKTVLLTLMIGMILLLAACGNTGSANSENNSESKNNNWPEKIALGVLPGEEEGEMDRGNKILANDLAEHLGIEVELFVGQDYNAVIEAMRSKKIDIASFGPFSYIIAAERSGAVPFAVRAVSKDDAFYHSRIIVPDESDVQSIEELEDKTMLFADPASTSGHLFPRMMVVKELEISNSEVEKFFESVSFSGGHDNSILAIAKGDADAAGVSSGSMDRMIKKGLIKESDFKIIKQSEPIPSSPMTYRGDLPEDLVSEIKEFFYNYDNEEFFSKSTKPEARYLEIDDSYFDVIRDTADVLEMSPDDLLNQ